MIGENREVMRLAKKRGEIGGEGVGECLPFRLIPALQMIEVIGKVLDAGSAQAPRQTAIHQLLLVLAQRDAGALMDQLADALKILVGEIKFAGE